MILMPHKSFFLCWSRITSACCSKTELCCV